MSKKIKPIVVYIYVSLLLICMGVFYQNNEQSISIDNPSINDLELYEESTIHSELPKKIAITFDDGPSNKYTEKLLDGLKEKNVKATFFLIGENAKQNPDIVKRISDEGHLIGNHTYSHIQLNCVDHDKAILEINQTNEIIEQITGKEVKFIRPPYGFINNKIQQEIKLTPILWTIDPRDWSVLNTKSVVKHVVKNAKNNDIILLHDIFDTSVEAAFQIIDTLQAQGFTFVTVDEIETTN